jgi:tRNA-specific 2-thiouridylase
VASRRLADGRRGLFRAADPDRDQSYFLYATTPEQLELLRFPLGELPKDDTRALARELGLAVADKADSQDICFVPQGRYSDIVERLKPGAVQAGEIVHVDGRVLGRHQGIIHYTVGQRRGLGVSVGEPLYVVRLDAGAARVVVGPREALATRTIRVTDVNWLGDRPRGDRGRDGSARAGALHPRARSGPPGDTATARGRAASPRGWRLAGQACVIYEATRPRAGSRRRHHRPRGAAAARGLTLGGGSRAARTRRRVRLSRVLWRAGATLFRDAGNRLR